MVQRRQYMNKLVKMKDEKIIKVITGIRRCGKSTLLELFQSYLKQNGVGDEQIISINFEDMQYEPLLDYHKLYEYITERLTDGRMNYVFLDEIQNVPQFQKVVDSLFIRKNTDVYITGSNAYMLSSDFSTLLSGRYVEIRMMPLSFREFLSFYEFAPDVSVENKFQKYLQFGGMPILHQFQFNEARSFEALEGIYNTVILRDVLERNKTADQALLHKLILFLCSNIGSITSPNNIGNVLTAEGEIQNIKKKAGKGVAGRTVDRYVQMLKNAFVFYAAGRYDVKGKQLLKTLEKNYIVDLGFRNMLLGFRDVDRGHVLENIVYLELLRRDYRVYIGKVGDTEVDFVAENPAEKLYIQVAETILPESVRESELRPLRSIRDNYEKIILSMDKSYITSYEGIKTLNIIDFLLWKR